MEKKKLVYIYITLFFFYMLILVQVAAGQSDEGFIYGRITTIDANSYTGEIRWGNEEAFWSDLFNSTKTSNDYIEYLYRSDHKYLKKNNRPWIVDLLNSFFGDLIKYDNDDDHIHVFVCQFGDMKTIEIKGKKKVDVEFKNGEIIRLKGGSNDIGAKVSIFDDELGQLEFKWSRIKKVEFLETPPHLRKKFGDPLYGTVETFYGDFTGFIQWDHDERLSTDVLDGDIEDGDVSIAFERIKSIEKDGWGSLVKLESGQEMYLTGSNDVNKENRGIIVTVPGVGRVDIKWHDFKKVVFDSRVKDTGLAYNNYQNPKKLKGYVITDKGEKIAGILVYDLDEAWDVELLHGDDNDLEYLIPFRNIKKISPKNYNYSTVELKNGEKLVLGDKQDVSDDNDGILIFTDNENYKYVPWVKVKEVVFH